MLFDFLNKNNKELSQKFEKQFDEECYEKSKRIIGKIDNLNNKYDDKLKKTFINNVKKILSNPVNYKLKDEAQKKIIENLENSIQKMKNFNEKQR